MSRSRWLLRRADERQKKIDGPFAQTKELIAGCTQIQVGSRDEFGPGDAVERFRKLQLKN